MRSPWSRAARQFGVLADHFAGHPTLGPLFAEIGRDERYHVAYSGRLLDEWRAVGRAREVARARRRVRLDLAWGAWRRAGRRIGDRLVRLLLATLFFTLVAPFGAVRRRRPDRPRDPEDPVFSSLDRAPLLRHHRLPRLRGEQRRVQGHGARALR